MMAGGESGVRSGRFADIRYVEETDSTNLDVAAVARAGAPEGVVIVTGFQRVGRGRRGRTWTAPPGSSLLASVLVRPNLAPVNGALVGLIAAVAAIEACEDVAGVSASLKWPNDVVVESAASTGIETPAGASRASTPTKLAGLLAESLVNGADLQAVVIGMGCNLRRAIVDDPCGPAAPIVHTSWAPAPAYLEDLARGPVDRDDLLHAWLAHLEGWCTTLEAPGGEGAAIEAYRQRCITLGRPVRVELADGSVEGQARELTDEGHLVVEEDGQRWEIAAGDVVHLRPRT